MAKMPTKIRIGTEDITVEICSQEDLDALEIHPPGETGAAFSYGKNKMMFNKNTPDSRRARYFLHEVIHACLARLNLDKDDEEPIVERLDEQLAMFIRDNPKAIKYLQESLNGKS